MSAASGKRWLDAVVRGVVVWFLAASLASLAVRLFFPKLADHPAPVTSYLVGAGIWVLAAVLGVSEARRYLRQAAAGRPRDRAGA